MSQHVSADDTGSDKQAVKWHTLFGSFFSYTLDAMDFMFLALALPVIIKEWNMPLGEAGLLGTATLIGVGLSSVVLGWYSDNYGRKKALQVSLGVFGLFTVAIAVSQTWEQFMVLRFLAGLGLGGVWGIASAYVSETWQAKHRARATSFVLSAWPVGYGLAALLSALILPYYGWRALFVCGLSSIVVMIYLHVFVPESKAWQENKRKREQETSRPAKVSVKELFAGGLARRTVLATLVSFCTLTAYWGINTWLPTYLTKERGLSVDKMGIFLIVINIGMFIGYQIFGYVADKIGRKKISLLSFFGAAMMIPLYVWTENVTVLFWMGPLLFLFFSQAGVFGAYFSELYPTHLRSMGAGFCFNVGRGLSAFAPYFLGQIATRYSLGTGFALCAITLLIGAVIMLFLPETSRPAQEPAAADREAVV
ncbi:MFS transporter [Brevibacillus brevis]|uniref:MFS transporter n=1 Tax=Brevibacillus brevis TaxID=1393 RepID=A0ABY9T004_BREBE|nr:MFS transporter [Brevibacillus brevis]WNC13381.1 MFS transporter [Brevibacillus brevis]